MDGEDTSPLEPIRQESGQLGVSLSWRWSRMVKKQAEHDNSCRLVLLGLWHAVESCHSCLEA